MMARLLQLLSAAALALAASPAEGESILTSEIGRQNNQSLLWGPYKPNLYFGVRPRLPEGLWTGLMWSRINEYTDVQTGELLSNRKFLDLLVILMYLF